MKSKNLIFWIIIVSIFLLPIFTSSTAQARCGYYAGYGYRCFGDKGGTNGKVFKQMDQNSKKCGYWNPGCQKSNRPTGNYQAPKSDNSYKSPTIGPGYVRPGSN